MGLMRHEHLYKNFTHTNFSANPFKNKDYRSGRRIHWGVDLLIFERKIIFYFMGMYFMGIFGGNIFLEIGKIVFENFYFMGNIFCSRVHIFFVTVIIHEFTLENSRFDRVRIGHS